VIGGSQFAFGGPVSQFAGGATNVSAFGGAVNRFANVTGTTNVGVGGGRSTNMAFMAGAARGAVPGTDVRGMAFRGGSMAAMTYNDMRRGDRGMGGLDIDNWQLNRTAMLRIDNTPGSNVYMNTNAMG
jgi:hypothetical protein